MRFSSVLLVVLIAACSSADASDAAPDGGGGAAEAGAAPDASAPTPTCSPGRATEAGAPASGPRIDVGADTKLAAGPVLLGANVNVWYGHAQGLWDPVARAPTPDPADKAHRAHLGLLRHPGGTAANLFAWKRAVGPLASRGCQIDGADGTGRPDVDYGPSEFVRLIRAVGAEGQIMVPFVRTTPADAADWVEYMNAPVGTNPNGGVAWAEVRQTDGSAAPYGITRWEIGNEQDRGGHQGYWMAAPAAQRLAQYIDGDDFAVTDEPLARDCDLGTTTTSSAPGQTFYFQYGLVADGTSPTIRVGGTPWRRVDDLSAAGPADDVYRWDRERASIQLGDGTHGAIPPAGQAVTASYRFHHYGFVAIYDAMKATAAQIGVDIDVCAAWAPPNARGAAAADIGVPSFAAAMKARGLSDRYDCVATHPYVNFARDFGDVWNGAAEAHDEMMVGDDWARTMVADLVHDVATSSTPGKDGRAPFVTISELGALWFTSDATATQSLANVRTANYGMSHALYMASQWLHYAGMHLGWVEGNTLVAEAGSMRGTLGGKATGFVYGAEAMTREAMGAAFAAGSTWVESTVSSGETVTAVGGSGSYPALVTGATRGADGALRLVVVNRRRDAASRARVNPGTFVHGAAIEVTTVQGDAFDSAGSAVAIARTTTTVQNADFDYTFPAASVTVLTLRDPCP